MGRFFRWIIHLQDVMGSSMSSSKAQPLAPRDKSALPMSKKRKIWIWSLLAISLVALALGLGLGLGLTRNKE